MRRFPKETSFSYFHPYGEKPQRDAAQAEWRRRYESLYLSREDSHLFQVASDSKFVSVGVQSPTEINAPRGCAVIL